MIAVLTGKEFLGEIPDDIDLCRALERRGQPARLAAWDDEGEDWSAYSGAVLRSVWGYHRRMPAFLAWLDGLEGIGLPLVNPPSTLRQNIYKHRQMPALAAVGLPVPKTVFLSRWEGENCRPPEASLGDALDLYFPGESGPFVMKPIVSASGRDTCLLENPPSREQEELYQALLAQRENIGVMLQPYLSEVDQGEYALVYLGGEYSHCALRFTGVLTGERKTLWAPDPPPYLLALGEWVLASLPQTPAYARVDAVDRADGPLLMELELAEPALFFQQIEDETRKEQALARFADSILAGLQAQR